VAELNDNGQYGRIECLPSTGYNVGAMNVTLITEDRGASIVDTAYPLVSFDNKLRPYHIVTHAGE